VANAETELITQLELIRQATALIEEAYASGSSAESNSHAHETYLSTKQLSERVPFSEGALRNMKSNGEFVSGRHFTKKGTKTIWIWSAVEEWLRHHDHEHLTATPFLSQGSKNGRS